MALSLARLRPSMQRLLLGLLGLRSASALLSSRNDNGSPAGAQNASLHRELGPWTSGTNELHEVKLPNVSFWAGALHLDWCMKEERQQVDLFHAKLLSKRGTSCTVVDVGTNDAFYSLLSGAFGCQTYGFEIQQLCIDFALVAVKKNNFPYGLVNITKAPVSDVGDVPITILFPDRPVCDGGFSFVRKGRGRSHSHLPLQTPHNLTTVALSSFPPLQPPAFVDIVKIDAEGHELEVLRGVLPLLRERRVGVVVVELGPMSDYVDPNGLIEIFREITSLRYGLTTLNCEKRRGDDDTFDAKNFEQFLKYAWMPLYPRSTSFWRCPDLLIAPLS